MQQRNAKIEEPLYVDGDAQERRKEGTRLPTFLLRIVLLPFFILRNLLGSGAMENLLGLVRVRVVRGVKLAARDAIASDPYVVLRMGKQKLKTSVKKGCLNPEWNEDLTLSISDPIMPISLEVFDKDTFSKDDRMGDAEIDIQPLLYAVKMGSLDVPNGTAIRRVQPSRENLLSDESAVIWNNGGVEQGMRLKLRNVECGEVVLHLQWVNLPGAKAL